MYKAKQMMEEDMSTKKPLFKVGDWIKGKTNICNYYEVHKEEVKEVEEVKEEVQTSQIVGYIKQEAPIVEPIEDSFAEGDVVYLKINGSGPFVLVRLHDGLVPLRVPTNSSFSDDLKIERAWIAQKQNGSYCYLWDATLTKKAPPPKPSRLANLWVVANGIFGLTIIMAGSAAIGFMLRDFI
jgi:hypothetical protein